MRSKFFTLTLAAAALAVAASATIPAVAASSTTLNVPFSFSVDGKVYPAGAYTVQRDALTSTMRMQSKDASQRMAWVAVDGAVRGEGRVILQFDNAGQTRALRTVQSGTLTTPRLDLNKKRKLEDISSDRAGQ